MAATAQSTNVIKHYGPVHTQRTPGAGFGIRDDVPVQLNLDLCLHIMMEVWLEQREKDCTRVCTVFLQAHSAGTGLVLLGDFKAMMRAMDLEQASMLPDRVVVCMFREALKLSQDGPAVTPQAFFQVTSTPWLCACFDYEV